MSGRRAILLLGAALGALFLFLAVRSLDWSASGAALADARPTDVALGLACVFAYYAVKALRWRFLVQPFVQARVRDLMQPVLAGLAGNYVFPHVGEIARALLAARRLGAPASALLASVAIERFFDFLALLCVVVVVLLPLGQMDRDIRTASLLVAALCAALLAAVVLFVYWTETWLRFIELVLRPVSGRFAAAAVHHLRQARSGLGAIGAPGLIAPVFGLSVLQWLLILGCVAFSLRSVDVSVSLAGVASTLLLNVIGLTLPAAPGHVGTVQLAFIVGLAPFGVPQEQAFAASVVYNCLMVVPTVVLGFPGLRQAGEIFRARLASR
jgi:glycosyltransferase 2 family protein